MIHIRVMSCETLELFIGNVSAVLLFAKPVCETCGLQSLAWTGDAGACAAALLFYVAWWKQRHPHVVALAKVVEYPAQVTAFQHPRDQFEAEEFKRLEQWANV